MSNGLARATSRTQLPPEFPFFTLSTLPADRLENRWDEILGVEDTKARLLRYVNLFEWFPAKGLTQSELSRHNAILLAGPQGTGKTQLALGVGHVWAKANDRTAFLVEVETHRLPSAQKGGSQQNVAKLWRDIAEVARLARHVFVVINEVETACGNRAAIDLKANPVDSMYAVNAFIEGWDGLVAKHGNVILLMTTNLPKAVDRAVSDRADFAITSALPGPEARARILASAVEPIERALGRPLVGRRDGESGQGTVFAGIVARTEGLSPRELRKLVLRGLTYAEHPDAFVLEHLLSAVTDYIDQRDHHEANGGVFIHGYQK